MPEIANVASGETIESAWGNQIRDRTVQRYATNAARDSAHPSPTEGDLCYVESTDRLLFHDGTTWITVLDNNGGQTLAGGMTLGGALDMDGNWITDVNEVHAADGSLSDPSYTFLSDQVTGLFLVAAGQLGITADSTHVLRITDTALEGTATGMPYLKLDAAGTEAAPAYTFRGNTGLGIWRSSADNMGFATGGTRRMHLTNDGDLILYDSDGSTVLVRFDRSDPALELSSGVALDLIGSGATRMVWSGIDRHSDSAPGSLRLDPADGYSVFQHTSSLRYKNQIRDLDLAGVWGFLTGLRPVTYHAKDRPADRRYVGFIAEEVWELEQAGLLPARFVGLDPDGQPDSVGPDGLVGLLVAAVTDLAARLTALGG